ncbi:MAG: prephenate dehydratase domain-containing protein [Clostridia bacterium]|jgi:chorismate mutase/prephenate dehydratase|nr:prephenate dehydratase domain-containing protein [Clostridia bacterium]
MDYKKMLNDARSELDVIDAQMLQLFSQRMDVIDKIAEIKRQSNIAITDIKREQQITDTAIKGGKPEHFGEISIFMRALINISKLRQRKYLYDNTDEEFLQASRTKPTGKLNVFYQGLPGAWGEQATVQLFREAARNPLESFEEVFENIKQKKANYGIVPIENSQTGAIGEVYDLLRKYGCYIVGQTWVKVKHCLMAAPGTKLTDVREIYSHPESFKQCRNFLKNRAWDLTSCRNTAVAAKMVADKADKRFAAIGSPRAAELYGLEIIAENITDDVTNQTRFITIANQPEYDTSCDTVSISFRTAHRSGALCEVLFPLMSESINLSRIESRPIRDGKFCFFADLKGNIKDENILRGIRYAAASCGYLEVLGCYRENAVV